MIDYNDYYKYLIIQSNGFCIDLYDREPVEFRDLLARGWRPVRETPFGGPGPAAPGAPAILVVLRRGHPHTLEDEGDEPGSSEEINLHDDDLF
ncbi:hypothetical protein Isop_2797 [Isosphaera pallida ATCC 43644]|uniref:Uncharacterized protein n=1 Tax=Isosphaera pallida (strain ATCC 43644 / DSM 9630 / IS1B) TaxID=575540 RepID=E8R112_ISOPI|nr:hypothetical protein [Isosphaera pallida]ADV63363.1 hypothetical protein Isop_2797 [Isosphaera pallida ATCC 43644]